MKQSSFPTAALINACILYIYSLLTDPDSMGEIEKKFIHFFKFQIPT
jgi:hypothetical protein